MATNQKGNKTTVKKWHDGIDSLYFETKTGSLNWYSLAEIFITLFNRDSEDHIEGQLLEDGSGLVFARTQYLKINPRIYEYMSNPNVRIHHAVETINCGRTSYTILQHIADNEGTVLVTNNLMLVYVDKHSRQSTPLPEFFRKAVEKSKPLTRFDLKEFACPQEYFKMVFTVVYTDLDSNGHATQTSYIRHAFNTFIAAVEVLDNVNINDVLSAQDVKFSYENEGNLGAKLVVKVWNDRSSGLHAEIVEEINPAKVLFRAFLVLGNKTAKL